MKHQTLFSSKVKKKIYPSSAALFVWYFNGKKLQLPLTIKMNELTVTC